MRLTRNKWKSTKGDVLIFATLIISLRSSIAVRNPKEASCKQPFTECDSTYIEYLPLNETWHLNLDGSWALGLLEAEGENRSPTNQDSFSGHVIVSRVRKCEVKVQLQNIIFGDEKRSFSESILVRVDKSSVKQVCRKPSTKSRHRTGDGSRDDQIFGLGSNVVTSILHKGLDDEELMKGVATILEDDNFGRCPTHYKVRSASKSEVVVTKTRNLQTCGKTFQKVSDESGNFLWNKASLQNFVEQSKLECKQVFENRSLKSVGCSHNFTMTQTAEFSSRLNLKFLSFGYSTSSSDEDFEENYDSLRNSERDLSEAQTSSEVQKYLTVICENSRNGLQTDVFLAFPRTLTLLEMMDTENIVKLFRRVRSGNFCPGNSFFGELFTSMMSDLSSPAAASAKCRIMAEEEVPINAAWASSLANTRSPTEETLRHCSKLLALPSWSKSVLGVSSLAGTFKSLECHPELPNDFDSCNLGRQFQSISRALWLKARNCLNKDRDYQQMALMAILGLSNLGSVGSDVTATLISCLSSPMATDEVKVAALKGLARKLCSTKTASWMASTVTNNDLSSEHRIEAFKALVECNPGAARDLTIAIEEGDIDLRSSQVASYIDSRSTPQNVTNFLKLSRHFDVGIGDILGTKSGTKLEGDLVFDESFIPRSVNLNLHSDLFKQYGGGGVGRFEIRQKNLEDFLQPIIGPGGMKGGLQSLLQDTVFNLVQMIKGVTNQTLEEGGRQKRSISVHDVKTSLSKVKQKLRTSLEGLVTSGVDGKHKYVSTFSFDPIFNELESSLQQYFDSMTSNLYTLIANYELSKGFSFTLRSEEALSWTFLGHRLRLRQQEGFLGTLKLSSYLNLFSLLRSSFNPMIEFNINPSVGAFWHSSAEFDAIKQVTEAKLETPLHSAFDLFVKVKPKVEEQMELTFDIPRQSFSGYSATIAKELSIKNDKERTVQEPVHSKVLEKKGLKSELLPKRPMKVEMEYSNCNEDVKQGLGISLCFESSVWKGERSSLVHSKFGVQKVDDRIDFFNVFISSKNPVENSIFLSAMIESEGVSGEKKSGTLVFGFNFEPHVTLKVFAESGKFSASYEATIVNDPNLKRLEARSKVGRREHGLKAEVLMVRDGGQVSLKPRLVVSGPEKKEDALLQGYMAHYSSDKVKSITVDVVTDGSLKKLYDVSLKGTTEYRKQASGDWTVSLKNLHLISPGIDFRLETTINVFNYNLGISSQATWNSEVVVLGGDFRISGITDSGAQYDVNLSVLSPSRPTWDTRITLSTITFDGQVSNNLTILNGPGELQWELNVQHKTSWKFFYTKVANDFKAPDLLNGFIRKGRSSRISNFAKVSIPSQNWIWKFEHDFQASDYSVENHIKLYYLDQVYNIMTNFFDQSEQRFKYHMEIELEFPDWKFSYVDTLLERGDGDVLGQSVTVMPSGRIYTASSRLKYENIIDYLVLELTHDTLVRDEAEEFRISFRYSMENTPAHFSLMLSLDNPEPIVNVELSLDGIGTHHVDAFMKSFLLNTYEVEMTSRSTGSETEVGLSLDLISLSKQIKSTVAVGSRFSGGGVLDGEVTMSSSSNPSFEQVSLVVSSSLEIEEPGVFLVKSSLSLMGWGWAAEMRTELGDTSSDPLMFTLTVFLPDKSRFEGKSFFQLDFQDDEQKIGFETQMKLPSGTIYGFLLEGETKLGDGSLTEANLKIDIDSPFTNHMFLKTVYENHFVGDQRNITFFCNTKSEANYWNELYINLNLGLDKDSANTTFEGKFGDKRVYLESFGSYIVQGDVHKVLMITEVKLPSGGDIEQLKISFDGQLISSSHPPGVKISQLTYVQKNHLEIFRSSGIFDVKSPDAKGSFAVFHIGKRFANQEYKMEGSFDGKTLEISIQGMVDHTPVRINVHYIDDEALTVSASYGGSSYASVEFTTSLQGHSSNIFKISSGTVKLTTNGNITFRNRRTRFHHVLRMARTHTSSKLRVNNIRGRPVKIYTSRTKLSPHQWNTVAKLEYGSVRVRYKDDITFKNFKEFDVKSSLDAPAFQMRDWNIHVVSKHNDVTDQTLSVKYTKETVVIHSGRFSIKTSSLESKSPFEINAELVDIVVEEKQYSDFKFRQFLALPENGLEMESILKRGRTPLAELGLSASKGFRRMLFSVCSTDTRCIRLNGDAHTLHYYYNRSQKRNFALDVKFLNSLFWHKYYDDVIEHSLVLTAENGDNEKDNIRLSGKLLRNLCDDLWCSKSVNKGKHHIYLSASPANLDLLYETSNRTMLLKSSVIKGREKEEEEEAKEEEEEEAKEEEEEEEAKESKTLKIQFWFDRINNPDDMIFWTTSYRRFDSHLRMVEVVKSVLRHPYVHRPLTLSGNFSTLSTFRREAVIDLDIFKEPHQALRLNLVKNYESGGYHFKLDLKNIEEEEAHLEMSTTVIPSPDAGLFDMKVRTPFLGGIEPNESLSVSYKCVMDVDTLTTNVNCHVDSKSVSEGFGLSYGLSSYPCSGFKLASTTYNKTHKVYGVYCKDPVDLQAGASLTDYVEDSLEVNIGFEGSNKFEVNLMEAVKGDVILLPPFLLIGSISPVKKPRHKIFEFKNILQDEWQYLVANSKITSSKMLRDIQAMLELVEERFRSSQIKALSNIIRLNSRNILEELKHDELFLDICSAVETSVNITSVLMEIGISSLEMALGKTLTQYPLSYYALEIYSSTVEAFWELFSYIQEEVQNSLEYCRGLIHRTKASIIKIYVFVLDETNVGEPLKYLQNKLESFASLTSSTAHHLSEIVCMGRKVLLLFYPSLNSGPYERYHLLFPVSESVYDLRTLLSSLSGGLSKRYSTVSLQDEVSKFLRRFLDPKTFIEDITPPFNGQGVLIRNGIITFDGSPSLADLSCPRLLLVFKGGNVTTPIAIATETSNSASGKNEILILIGDDAIRLKPDRSVLLNNFTLNLPYEEDMVQISRDIHEIKVTLKDYARRKFVSLSCEVHRDICILDVNGWLFSDTQGLFSSLDYEQSNDFMLPNRSIIRNRHSWISSWKISEKCSGKDLEFAFAESEKDSRLEDICAESLLDKNSPSIPCHATVDVYPYYSLCLKALKTMAYSSEGIEHHSPHRRKRNIHPKMKKLFNLGSNTHFKTINTKAVNEAEGNMTFSSSVSESLNTSLLVRRRRSSEKRWSYEVEGGIMMGDKRENEYMCDILAAYSHVCYVHGKEISLPVECDKGAANVRKDTLDSKTLRIDLLILLEESQCSTFIKEFVISPLKEDFDNSILKPKMDLHVGVIGYGTSSEDSVAFYGKGASLLSPIKDFTPPSSLPVIERGTIQKAFEALRRYPFRSGTIRVVFVAACSDMDLNEVTSAGEQLRERRILLFSLTPNQLLKNILKPKAERNTIGFDSYSIHHLKRGRIHRGNSSALHLPSSNIAHLSLQSGGSVFSVAGLQNERKAAYYMKLFRQSLVKNFIKSSKTLYSNIVSQL